MEDEPLSGCGQQASTLREAAGVLRRLAESATPGAWGVGNGNMLATGVTQTGQGSFSCDFTIAEMTDENDRWRDGGPGEAGYVDNPAAPVDDAAYIALVQPTVGSALAAWLEAAADDETLGGDVAPAALAVADAVLAVRDALKQQLRYDLPPEEL